MNQTKQWASHWGKYRTNAEIMNEFRELERQKRIAGWRRNILVLGAVVALVIVYIWNR